MFTFIEILTEDLEKHCVLMLPRIFVIAFCMPFFGFLVTVWWITVSQCSRHVSVYKTDFKVSQCESTLGGGARLSPPNICQSRVVKSASARLPQNVTT